MRPSAPAAPQLQGTLPVNDQTTTENALATLANIGDLCAGRDQAIEHWHAAFDSFQEHTAAADRACIGGGFGLSIPSARRYEDAATND